MNAVVASIPILLVVILMIAFNMPAKKALPTGWIVTVLIAVLYWKQDVLTTAAWAWNLEASTSSKNLERKRPAFNASPNKRQIYILL